jgi:hypothetical protein
VALQGGGDCADYADIKRAKEVGKDCAATLGPNQAGLNYKDITAPPGGDDSAAERRRNRHFDGDPSTQVPVTAPAPPANLPGGDAGPSAAPPVEVPKPDGGSGPIQIPELPGVNVPKIGGGTPTGGEATDQRTDEALLDYLMGH